MKKKSLNSISVKSGQVLLSSPAFEFVLDTRDGLRAVAWTNRLTGRTLNLGGGPEVEFDLGLPDQPVVTPRLRVTKLPAAVETGDAVEAVFELEADEPEASVTVTYRWDGTQSVLRKFVTITNCGTTGWNRLLNARLGEYATGAAKLTGGELVPYPPSFAEWAHQMGGLQGFPVYADDEFFFSLAHPAGWATQEPGKVSLRHYPGVKLPAGESRDCMEAVYGVGAAGAGRAAFVAHIRSRMRRVARGHDRPYAIFEPFGAGPDGYDRYDESETLVLDMIGKVAEGRRASDCPFDYFLLDFWVDQKGDLKRANPRRFPNQFETIKQALAHEGIKPGLWLDSTLCAWTIGNNPATAPSVMQEVGPEYFAVEGTMKQLERGYVRYCRSTEPIRSMYKDAFIHHLRANGVRLFKFDCFYSRCDNPRHEHLPGEYGNEANHEALIEFYRALDAECPEAFIMLYWGYRSPWWLLHADTMFETGMRMEAASPGHMPAPYIRDGVTRTLDQGHVYAKDVPWLGTDSLGVWLSHWGGWNSGMGPERWQPSFVMDICRGNALAQPWSDPDWLTPPERQQMGEFIALMKANPGCFTNARLILGDPWKDEPYGYVCSDGRKAFVAVNNGTWHDRNLALRFAADLGLPAGKAWDIYRWYPNPAKLAGGERAGCEQASLSLRPFEVVLLEVLPRGEAPSLGKRFPEQDAAGGFAEPSRPVQVTVASEKADKASIERIKLGGRNDLHGMPAMQTAGVANGALCQWQGDFALPSECMVFAPFKKGDGIPSVEALSAVPASLELGGRRVEGRSAVFGPDRILDLAPFLGDAPGQPTTDAATCALVYVPFTCEKAGPATFGFGMDWWYEAWLDGKPISETVQSGGNAKSPIGIANHTVTVDLMPGPHVLVLRCFRGKASATLAVGGPRDFESILLNTPEQVIRGEIPATRAGGLFVVVLELSLEGKPFELGNIGQYFSAHGLVDRQPAEFRPALGPQTYPSSWQAWRYAVLENSPSQTFELRVMNLDKQMQAQPRFSAYWLPK